MRWMFRWWSSQRNPKTHDANATAKNSSSRLLPAATNALTEVATVMFSAMSAC